MCYSNIGNIPFSYYWCQVPIILTRGFLNDMNLIMIYNDYIGGLMASGDTIPETRNESIIVSGE
jgi:hypothetical protein